ncbi:MAG: hypothetical protein R3A11_09485 [Bdellovibrionota bacterium]
MSIQIDQTELFCHFCQLHEKHVPLVRSMHGLYCSNEYCYSRSANGNLVPASQCENCRENAFYFEEDGTIETGAYRCIACGHIEPT